MVRLLMVMGSERFNVVRNVDENEATSNGPKSRQIDMKVLEGL